MRRRMFLAGMLGTLPSLALAQKAPVRVAVFAPLTGEFGPLGQTVLDAAQISAREVGLSIIPFDTSATPEGAIAAVTAAAKDATILAGLGPLGIHESVAASATAQRLGLPMLSLCPDPVVERGGSVWRWRTSPAEQATLLVREILRQKVEPEAAPWTRAAILYPRSSYGRDATAGFVRAWQQAGREVVRVSSYPEEKPDLRRALEALVGSRHWVGAENKALKPDKFGYVTTGQRAQVDFDVLFIPDFHTRVSRILGFLPLVKIQNGEGGTGRAVQLLGLGGWRGETMALTGSRSAGALVLDSYGGADQGGRAEEFERLFESHAQRLPTSLEAEVFDAVWWLFKVGSRATRRQDFFRAAAGISAIEGASGATRVEGGRLVRSMTLFRMDVDGRIVPI